MVRRRTPQNPKDMWPYNGPPSAKQNSVSISQSVQLKANTLNMETQSIIEPTTPHTFFTAYGPKLKVTLDCPPGFGRTKQAFKAETDINTIIASYLRTGVLDFAKKHEPRYGDVIGADFQSAMNIIASAKSMFEDLPAQLRARFENDPAKFLDFVQDERNTAELEELGLSVPTEASAGAAEAAATSPQAQAAASAEGAPEAPEGASQQREGRRSRPKDHSDT